MPSIIGYYNSLVVSNSSSYRRLAILVFLVSLGRVVVFILIVFLLLFLFVNLLIASLFLNPIII